MYDILPFPNITATEPEEQIVQINNYLIQLKEELEFALTNITSENLSQELRNALESNSKSADGFTTEQLSMLQQMSGKGVSVSDVVNSKEFALFSDGLKEYSDQNEKDANAYTDEKFGQIDYSFSGVQTQKSDESGGLNVYTFTSPDGSTSVLEVMNGLKGDPGVSVPTSAFFSMWVDENGDLYVRTLDGAEAPPFRYESETGDLYWEM